jgi:hypothetical protein
VNEADPCDLLTADAAEALAGEPMVERMAADLEGVPACQMSGDTRGVQVAQVPATEWAASVPEIIDVARSSGEFGGANQTHLDEVAARLAEGELDGLAACEVFSTMLEIAGEAPGQSRTVRYVPDGVAPQGISAQSCVDGTYTSLLLVGPDIVVSEDITAAIEATHDLVGAA